MDRITSVAWAELGWGAEPPTFGRIRLIVVSPWCPDCQAIGPRLRARYTGPVYSPYVVSEFAAANEIAEFTARFAVDLPILTGTLEKSDAARDSAAITRIRQSWGDERRWGVPLWIEGVIVRSSSSDGEPQGGPARLQIESVRASDPSWAENPTP